MSKINSQSPDYANLKTSKIKMPALYICHMSSRKSCSITRVSIFQETKTLTTKFVAIRFLYLV